MNIDAKEFSCFIHPNAISLYRILSLFLQVGIYPFCRLQSPLFYHHEIREILPRVLEVIDLSLDPLVVHLVWELVIMLAHPYPEVDMVVVVEHRMPWAILFVPAMMSSVPEYRLIWQS